MIVCKLSVWSIVLTMSRCVFFCNVVLVWISVFFFVAFVSSATCRLWNKFVSLAIFLWTLQTANPYFKWGGVGNDYVCIIGGDGFHCLLCISGLLLWGNATRYGIHLSPTYLHSWLPRLTESTIPMHMWLPQFCKQPRGEEPSMVGCGGREPSVCMASSGHMTLVSSTNVGCWSCASSTNLD